MLSAPVNNERVEAGVGRAGRVAVEGVGAGRVRLGLKGRESGEALLHLSALKLANLMPALMAGVVFLRCLALARETVGHGRRDRQNENHHQRKTQ